MSEAERKGSPRRHVYEASRVANAVAVARSVAFLLVAETEAFACGGPGARGQLAGKIRRAISELDKLATNLES